ncbi:MAG TPA: hypothetical protein VGG75_13310 [Trebonia sp.]|jgi:hypothetical protein
MLALTASRAAGIPVSLSDAVTGLDGRNARLAADAALWRARYSARKVKSSASRYHLRDQDGPVEPTQRTAVAAERLPSVRETSPGSRSGPAERRTAGGHSQERWLSTSR